MTVKRQILVSEVGPRDGLQSINTIMPTASKLQWIAWEHACGVREIEVGLLFHPKYCHKWPIQPKS